MKESGKIITLSGDELGSLNDIKELRKKARTYYHENIQGKVLNHKEIGEIRFTKSGGREIISQAAQNINLFPKLLEIIESSKYLRTETPDHDRSDNISRFHILSNKIKVGDRIKNYEFLIAEDYVGKKLYFIKNAPGSLDRETVTGATRNIYIITD